MKISQYESILLSNITSSDLLYIVDSNETDSKLSSKNVTYATFIKALDRDLSRGGKTYINGNAINISADNSINVVISDLTAENGNIFISNNKLSVEPSTAKVTYLIWD